MKKTSFILLAIAVLMAVFATACGGAQNVPTAAPAPTQAPQQPAAPVDTQPVAPAPTNQAFAPVCQTTASSCAAPEIPIVEAANTYCVEKIPYTNIPVPDGTTFEVLDKSGDYSCTDTGTHDSDGKLVITCTGKELFKFDVKFTNSACGASALQTGTGQCQDGFGFDAAQGCCAPLTAGDGGSVVVTVNLGGCPGPQ